MVPSDPLVMDLQKFAMYATLQEVSTHNVIVGLGELYVFPDNSFAGCKVTND